MSKLRLGAGEEGDSKHDETLSEEMEENASCLSNVSNVPLAETSETLLKSFSTTSVDSATSITSLEMNEPVIFTHAPNDVFGEDKEVGKMRVARAGESLPVEKWKLKKGCDIAVKFRVSETLEVTVINRKNHPGAQQNRRLDSSMGPGMTSTPKKNTPVFAANFNGGDKDFEVEDGGDKDFEVEDEEKETNKKDKTAENKPRSLSKQEWLSNLSTNFIEIVVDGLEVCLRDKVAEKVKQKKKLTPKENMALIHSVNHHIFKWIGRPQAPDGPLSRDIAQMFKQFIPETFAFTEMVMTEFGPLPVKKSKGEGGVEGLATRIANNFYNRYVRVDITRPDVASDAKVDFSAKKQPRKFYAICPEKWNLAKKMSQKEYDDGLNKFSTFDDLESLEAKAEALETVREFLQIGFRTEDPSVHIIKYSKFWKQPDGIKLLSMWFEWLVGGSKDGDISKSIAVNLDFVLRMLDEYMTEKRGEAWSKSMEDIERESLNKHGNLLMFQVALIRELAKMWGNKGEQLIYIEGKDEMKNMSNQPFIHAVSVHKPGE